MAKPMPSMVEPEEVEPEVLRELMPMTSPSTFSSAPPELPALMAASVWIMLR